MILLRQRTFSEGSWKTRKPKTLLGRIIRGDIVEWRRLREYKEETGHRPFWRFGRKYRNFKNWQRERYGDAIDPFLYS